MQPAKRFSGLLGNGIRALGTRYDHLTLAERKLIFQLREAKISAPRIAERLGRHRSTIHREIRRNWHDDGPWLRGYFPEAAQSRTDRRPPADGSRRLTLVRKTAFGDLSARRRSHQLQEFAKDPDMTQAPAAFILASLLALSLGASADAALRARPSTTYRCTDQRRFVASYPDPSTAVLTYKGHVRTLRAAPSADGVRYVGAGWQWWTKGTGQGTMTRLKPGETIASGQGVVCTAQRR